MESFARFQSAIDQPYIALAIEGLLIGSVTALFASSLLHWLVYSSSLRLPIAIFLFYLIKLFSDTSLTLSNPSNTIWQNITIGSFVITENTFFHANVDAFCGLVLLSLFYFRRIGKLNRDSIDQPRSCYSVFVCLCFRYSLWTYYAVELYV